jgi:hypothetical protein
MDRPFNNTGIVWDTTALIVLLASAVLSLSIAVGVLFWCLYKMRSGYQRTDSGFTEAAEAAQELETATAAKQQVLRTKPVLYVDSGAKRSKSKHWRYIERTRPRRVTCFSLHNESRDASRVVLTPNASELRVFVVDR